MTYRSFTLDFRKERYLEEINVGKFRIALARLRIVASYLHKNRRFINPKANIKCPFCTKDETELHFPLECTIYNDLRNKHLIKHFENLSIVTLLQLLANTPRAVSLDVATLLFRQL